MTSVVVADDQDLVRSGLELVLGARGCEVVGLAADGREAVETVARLEPEVVLMDIRMPVLDGLAATRRLTGTLPDVRVVVLTTFSLDEYVFEALRAGASGFLLKDTEPAELLRAVRVAAQGDALLSPSITRRLVEEYANRAKAPAVSLDELTDREREVVALVGTGLSNDEIAARLFLRPLTAKTHVSRGMGKLGVRDRAQLVVLAYESGLVRPGWA